MTRTGSPSRAIAPVASSTAAPPDMSNFISLIFAPGLSEIPPESNVTALPTSPSTGPSASGGSYRSVISCGSSCAPRATAANAPMPAASIPSRPSDSALRPSSSAASSAARSASREGVRSLAGAFWRSRAALAAVAMASARITAADTSWWADSASCIRRSGSEVVLYFRYA